MKLSSTNKYYPYIKRNMGSIDTRILFLSKWCKVLISSHPYFSYQNDFKHSTSLMQRDFSSLGIHINIKALLNKYRMFMILRWAYTYIYFMIQKPFVYKCFRSNLTCTDSNAKADNKNISFIISSQVVTNIIIRLINKRYEKYKNLQKI